MKTLLQRSLIILAILLSVNSKAQTTVDIVTVMDSSGTGYYCTTPVTIDLMVWGTTTGYTPVTDSLDIQCFWDDGTDTTFRERISGGSPSYFFPDLTHIYTSGGTYDIKVIVTGPDGKADTLISAPIVITSGCEKVDGYCYYDNNNNCIFDAGDDTLAGVPIVISISGNVVTHAYTNTSGYYSADLLSGLTGLEIRPSSYWSSAYSSVNCPASGFYTFNSTGPASFDFGLDCTASGYDLSVYSFGRVAAPGSSERLTVHATNWSCTSTPAIITLTLDPDVTYVDMASGPAPSSVMGNVLTWNIIMNASVYYWGAAFNATLNIKTNTNAVIFDTACFTVSIDPTASDININNNTYYSCRIIGGPYDPNNKEVSPAGIGANGNIAPDEELTYIINFQNTGTAPAINVYIKDTISSNLDMSTFKIVASSHAMNPYFLENNSIRFDYPNIMLPDSNVNEPLSHGWVVYKIKTKTGLANGTRIKNTGYIYFDYNAPIVTNTTLNTIDIAMGIAENSKEIQTMAYPNPATEQLTIVFGESVSGMLSIVDMTGRTVKTLNINRADQVIVNLDGLSSGLYGLTMPGVQLKETRIQVIK
ncbi:MAG: DUF7619 domain-containing protein [Bacteroidota bacterium]